MSPAVSTPKIDYFNTVLVVEDQAVNNPGSEECHDDPEEGRTKMDSVYVHSEAVHESVPVPTHKRSKSANSDETGDDFEAGFHAAYAGVRPFVP